MKPTVKRLRDALLAAKDGVAANKAICALGKIAAKDDAEAKAVLADYVLQGKEDHLRESACSELAGAVNERDEELAGVFQQGLSDQAIRYWSILGCINTRGTAAYEELIGIACDPALSVEDRGHAVKCLASHSGQPFDRQLPADPGDWQLADLRVSEIAAWSKSGHPCGSGYPPPVRHPALDKPQTVLEQAVSRLDKKLAKKRGKRQDRADPTDWLAVADADDLGQISKRWKLPAVYLDFLSRFSPVKAILVSRRFPNGGLQLFGAGELIEAQDGYGFHPGTAKRIRGWPKNYVVIANHGGDPFVLDLSSSDGIDAPVVTAEHGMGQWDFGPVADSFAGFLKSLAQ